MNPFGTITAPQGVSQFSGGQIGGIAIFVNLILKLLIIGAGLFTLFNFVMAGYGFLSSNNEPKKIEDAWAKIWQSVLGLAVAAGAFTLAGIFGKLLFNDWNAILQLRIITPN